MRLTLKGHHKRVAARNPSYVLLAGTLGLQSVFFTSLRETAFLTTSNGLLPHYAEPCHVRGEIGRKWLPPTTPSDFLTTSKGCPNQPTATFFLGAYKHLRAAWKNSAGVVDPTQRAVCLRAHSPSPSTPLQLRPAKPEHGKPECAHSPRYPARDTSAKIPFQKLSVSGNP
jgi:hypothetical protein